MLQRINTQWKHIYHTFSYLSKFNSPVGSTHLVKCTVCKLSPGSGLLRSTALKAIFMLLCVCAHVRLPLWGPIRFLRQGSVDIFAKTFRGMIMHYISEGPCKSNINTNVSYVWERVSVWKVISEWGLYFSMRSPVSLLLCFTSCLTCCVCLHKSELFLIFLTVSC